MLVSFKENKLVVFPSAGLYQEAEVTDDNVSLLKDTVLQTSFERLKIILTTTAARIPVENLELIVTVGSGAESVDIKGVDVQGSLTKVNEEWLCNLRVKREDAPAFMVTIAAELMHACREVQALV
jgi:hypothetical protein